MSSLSIAKSRNPKSVTPKKGSAKSNATTRRKVPSTAATPKKPLRSVESKAERVAAAKTPVKIDKPKVVKKKLGFPLTSLKPNDGVRRYRIETRRAR
jgi:hypothetical protein